MAAAPIAVIGMGCRFPKAPTPTAFWELLDGGVDAITEVPPDRWNADELYSPVRRTPGKMCTRWGGFLEDVDAFDPIFFRIMPAEAGRIDPQHRLVLEVGWEALESAGLDPSSLAHSATGVFIGLSHSDHDRLLYRDRSRIDGYNGPNTYHCFAANRLSYLLNLHGPSIAVDTACSSALVAVHLACQSLHTGETDLALAGGVNLNLTPEEFIALSFLGVLSGDPRSKTFDAESDGYVRGEGCGVLVLKRLEDAIRCRDPLLAVIRGSAVNHNGLSNGITAPNGAAQEAVLRRALIAAEVDPSDVNHIEVMGTATALGDPIEVAALKSVYLPSAGTPRECWIGSVKPNIGHLEAASGAASLIKVILSLQHGQIPRHLHCDAPSPRLRLDGTGFVIPRSTVAWTRVGCRRRAGVSAFGFGGTNAHMILEEAVTAAREPDERPRYLLTLSAKTEGALRELTGRYLEFLRRPSPPHLGDVCFTANTGRSMFEYRAAIITASNPQLCEQLEALQSGRLVAGVHAGRAARRGAIHDAPLVDGSLEEAALRYVAGQAVDWSSHHDASRARRVSLPSYPFQRQRCRWS